MDVPLPQTELVEQVEDVADSLREYSSKDYDGVTESGAGPLFVVLPGRSMEVFEDHVEEMDPLPWADVPQSVYLDDYDEDLIRILYEVDRYTDGAILINGAGRISNYTYELEPDVKIPENYPEGSGTKLRAAVNSSAVELPEKYLDELPYARSSGIDEEIDSTVEGSIYVPRNGDYGDVVAVTVTSSRGRRYTFDEGEIAERTDPVQPSQDVSDLWQQLREEAVENDEPLRRFDRSTDNEEEPTAELGDLADVEGVLSGEGSEGG